MQGVNKVNYHPDEAPITADNEIILFFTDIVSLDLERLFTQFWPTALC